MDLAWTASLDQLWRSPTFPMWLTLVAAAFFAIVFFVIVLRADRSVANGALVVMTLLAVGIAAAATVRGSGNDGQHAANAGQGAAMGLPALSCIDELAGDDVESACEKILFGSPDHVAAAVSYTAANISRLTALGDASAVSKTMTPDLMALRRALERDRYGFVAHVLVTREGCTAGGCPVYRSLTDHSRIAANMDKRTYDELVARYMPSWSGGPVTAVSPASAVPGLPNAMNALAGEAASAPTGKPTNAEFPSASSIPPVSIMTSEPAAAATTSSTAPAPAPRSAAAGKAPAASHATAPPKRRSNAQPKAAAPAPAPPVQLAPAPGSR